MFDVLYDLYAVIEDRKRNPQEGSYTNYLLDKGMDKILKKVGEECAETIIAAKNGDGTELENEVCDLVYHLLVMLSAQGVGLDGVKAELVRRSEKQKNLKVMKQVDKNT